MKQLDDKDTGNQGSSFTSQAQNVKSDRAQAPEFNFTSYENAEAHRKPKSKKCVSEYELSDEKTSDQATSMCLLNQKWRHKILQILKERQQEGQLPERIVKFNFDSVQEGTNQHKAGSKLHTFYSFYTSH